MISHCHRLDFAKQPRRLPHLQQPSVRFFNAISRRLPVGASDMHLIIEMTRPSAWKNNPQLNRQPLRCYRAHIAMHDKSDAARDSELHRARPRTGPPGESISTTPWAVNGRYVGGLSTVGMQMHSWTCTLYPVFYTLAPWTLFDAVYVPCRIDLSNCCHTCLEFPAGLY